MPLRESQLDTPVVVEHTTETLMEVTLRETADGPVIIATWLTPGSDGSPQKDSRRLTSDQMAGIMADPAMVALLDAIVAATRTGATPPAP